ncbi:ATP-binding protein [Devosia oryziradicis]|uniref:ATP-binding protein n=1 Tax=Devosia oryziradicis TaxID=2801335 RepID=A0ABX7BSJ5_9HYPH|nr:ATP-binding protein [Devosia oryziradicis]QQR34761.1 ATP-binding protein [Devosia oryziradicis]
MTDKNKTDYAEMLKKPEYENLRTLLRDKIVPTRQLNLITSQVARAQQQIAARFNEGAFWSADNSLPIDGVLIVGESGSGKSFGLRYAMQTLPAIALLDGGVMESSPFYVDTPTHGTFSMLAKEIVRRADGVDVREPKDQDAPGKAISAIGRHGFTMVAVDEISRIINPQRHNTKGLAVQSHLVWTMAIELLNLSTSPTPIALSGLPHVLDSFMITDKKEDAQKVRREAHRRMRIVRLPELDPGLDRDMLLGAIHKYCEVAKVETKLTEADHIVPRLVHASFNQAGSALEWIQKAVALAKVRPRGKLDREDFAYVYGDMTSAARSANPFLASGWDRIDIGKIAPRSFSEAIAKPEAA